MVTLSAHPPHRFLGSPARMEDYTVEGEIRGYHVYKTAWTPVIGHMLDVQAESAASPRRHRATCRSRLLHMLRACVSSTVKPPFFAHPKYKSHVANFKQIS